MYGSGVNNRKIYANVDNTLAVSALDGTLVISRDTAGYITDIQKTDEMGRIFTKTITRDGSNNIIGISAWTRS